VPGWLIRSSLLFTSSLIALGSVCFAQASVEDGAFDLMLQGLLSHSVGEIPVTDAHADSVIMFLDARSQREYDVSHIQNGQWVGHDHFDISRVKHLSRQQSIVVYCSVGYRSEKVAEKLLDAGFENVTNLYGGIFEWKNRGYSVYDRHGETDNIHAFGTGSGVWLKKGNKIYE